MGAEVGQAKEHYEQDADMALTYPGTLKYFDDPKARANAATTSVRARHSVRFNGRD